jgi:hypothetical protein
VRVRQFELRLLAAALTVMWAAGGGIVLIAYRPGGPVDLLVGVAASLPLMVSVAAFVWPPLVRSDPESAGIFWIGIIAGLLLLPSIGGVAGQVLQGGAVPLVPSPEIVYPWAMALLATSLFAGLGITRQLIPEVGIGRRRLATSIAFAVAATTVIGGVFAGVSLADDAALREKPAAYSRYGPTDAKVAPPDCTGTIVTPRSGSMTLDLWGDVDQRAIGNVNLTGSRSGSDYSFTAQVVSPEILGQYGGAKIGAALWLKTPDTVWTATKTEAVASSQLDEAVLAGALSIQDRATAENHGLEYVEGARARRCRIAVDGPSFAASFPQTRWLVGDASMTTWRGQVDYWLFGDGEVGRISGSVNGNAQAILGHGLLATIAVRFDMVDRDRTVTISPPRG